ncbi:hypothetical protein N7326_00140 [Corynebacterium sp. ES2794-CONJ1]|nr:hypothetical protein [Corynebacterium sp. ES2775-CONJ]MCS4489391.1 hypothetical protein [Corynebacterium sp. ES2775-CONJ]MCU9518282.1 hypothetical protein [Corynebacterium sp. ES2794-CONJ1]
MAQSHGGAGRPGDKPPVSDRLTIARRVRGYVTTSSSPDYQGHSASEKATSSERKALATMRHKGCKKAAECWENDPNGEDTKAARKKLQAANAPRQSQGKGTRGRVLATAMDV